MSSLENLTVEARDELALLAQQLAENPTTRKEFLRMTKKVKPDIPIPELDLEENLEKMASSAQKRVEELESKLREREAREELDKRRQTLRKKGLAESDEDIEAIEKVMLDKGITSHETAAEYHEWMKQAAAPTPSSYKPSVMKNWDLAAYMKNPQQAARETAAKALQEIRTPKRPIGL